MNEYLFPNVPFFQPFIKGIAIYGVTNGSNQRVITLTSCHIGQKSDRCYCLLFTVWSIVQSQKVQVSVSIPVDS